MSEKWYEPADGLSIADRLRRPLVSHAPAGVITDADLARQLVDDRSEALVRIAELEAALREARAMLRVVSLDEDADELRASWDRGIAKIDAALGN